MHNMEYVNEVTATGRVIATREYRSGQRLITLYINEHSYPQFVCKSADIPEELDARTKLTVSGYISNIPYKDRDNRIHQRQRLIATNIAVTKTMTEEIFGIKGKFAAENSTHVYLKGILTAITNDERYYRYRVLVNNKNIMISMKKLERHPHLQIGDTICCVGLITTQEKGEGVEKKRYENVLVTDLAKID